MTKIDHIYIVHALKGYEKHKSRLQEILPSTKIDFSFVTEGDPSIWKVKTIEKYFTKDIQNTLSKGVLSCTLNHILAYENMNKAGFEFAIFFENDPFFLNGVEGFRPKVEALLHEAKLLNPGFIISLENTTLRFPNNSEIVKDKFLYKKQQGRAAGAYIIDKKGVEKILNDLKINKCNTVIDWWHNDMIKRNVVDMYWAHPCLTEQGSHNGKLNAGISSKNASIFRQLKWKAQKAYKTILYKFR